MVLIMLNGSKIASCSKNFDYNMCDSYNNKNPAAVALGRLGGLKGGKARAEKLSKKRRFEIAKEAAMKRWRK